MTRTRKKVLLFARDAGAANCLIPIFRYLKKRRHYAVDLYGQGVALALYKKEKYGARDLGRMLKKVTAQTISGFLQNKRYDCLITGTTYVVDKPVDRLLWQEGHKLAIPSIVILDNWQNYTARFSFTPPGGSGARVDVLPDKICVMDDYARREMLVAGFPERVLSVTGQPYLETVMARKSSITLSARQALREKLGVNRDGKLITFASEAIVENKGCKDLLGYDQLSILSYALAVLVALARKSPHKNFVLAIKPHPGNNKHIFDKMLARARLPANVKTVLEHNASSRLMIAASDTVVGMASMFLIEAALSGKPFLSIQIGLRGTDPFVLSRRGLVETIRSQRTLKYELTRALNGKLAPIRKPFLLKNANGNIVSLIDRMLYEHTRHQRRAKSPH